jgi:hypothetical protein
MVKEKCKDIAEDGLFFRDQLMGLSVDILDPKTRRERYDISGFHFVAGNYASELRKKGYEMAAKKVEDAARKYPPEFHQSAVDSSVDLAQAIVLIQSGMFEKFCECEKL